MAMCVGETRRRGDAALLHASREQASGLTWTLRALAVTGSDITGTRPNSPTEYDFVGGDFDAALVEYRPKSPQIACFRACGAPWDAIRVGVARRGT